MLLYHNKYYIKWNCINFICEKCLTGFPFTTITVMFVTYCLIQLIKEMERRQALIDDPDPIPPPAPVPPPTNAPSATTVPSTTQRDAAVVHEPVDANKEKAE